MQVTTIIGLCLGIGGVLLGQVLEGGHLSSLFQLTAFTIVVGGTLGAVLVSTSSKQLALGIKLLPLAFKRENPKEAEIVLSDIVEAAQIARKESILALEQRLVRLKTPFMQSVFRFVIDGIEPATIKDVFENEIDLEEERLNAAAKVFLDAGGFAPTIGIIGAVLGLIHVMENLTDTTKLGSGIAVAFVATVYGVGLANLVLIPIGNKLRSVVREQMLIKEMILVGALGIVHGLNPLIIEEKLKSFLSDGSNRRRA
jgi:chemotaxis protein MotA